MKKIFLFAAAVATLTSGSACSSDDRNSVESTIPSAELPATAKAFIETHFNTAVIARIEKDTKAIDDYYEVDFIDGFQIDFDETGNWTEVDGNNQKIPTDFINSDILVYVSENHPTTAIESIDKKPYGFDIDLLNNTELRFDLEGKFLGLGN